MNWVKKKMETRVCGHKEDCKKEGEVIPTGYKERCVKWGVSDLFPAGLRCPPTDPKCGVCTIRELTDKEKKKPGLQSTREVVDDPWVPSGRSGGSKRRKHKTNKRKHRKHKRKHTRKHKRKHTRKYKRKHTRKHKRKHGRKTKRSRRTRRRRK